MSILNFGSINLDHIYQVDHFVRPGETLASSDYQVVVGGKGANQSVALARAGAQVVHVGAINRSDEFILDQLSSSGVIVDDIAKVDAATGHAIIQINQQGENAIILFPGANHSLTEDAIDRVLNAAEKNDWVLLQNETNAIAYIIQRARNLGLHVAFNPAPMKVELTRSVLNAIDLLIVNEVEAMDLMGVARIEVAVEQLQRVYPDLGIIMTLGSFGVRYLKGAENRFVPAFKVEAVDTTAAGDTFIGYCLAALQHGHAIEDAMKQACAASALCVTKLGAVPAIPTHSEVESFLRDQSPSS